MWKADRWRLDLESLRRHLCPHCDSLGPHRAVSDAYPWDPWLECIDCGTVLGRLTPQGVEPLEGSRRPEPIAHDRFKRQEGDANLCQWTETAGRHHLQPISETLQHATQGGLLWLKARR
jgi:hypothetical protein